MEGVIPLTNWDYEICVEREELEARELCEVFLVCGKRLWRDIAGKWAV